MKFFKTLGTTFYKPAFYESVGQQSVKEVIKFYSKFAFFLGFVSALISALVFTPTLGDIIKSAQNEILSTYPEGLEIKIDKGVATTNAKTEPYNIPFKDSWKKSLNREDVINQNIPSKNLDNILVLNTKQIESPTIESFKLMSTYGLLTNKYLVYYGKNDSVVFTDLSRFPDFVVNQSVLKSWLSLARFIPTLVPFLYLFFIFVTIFFSLAYILLLALIFLLLQKTLKKNFTFAESYKICVYASVVPAILDLFFFFAGIRIPMIFTLLTLAIALINSKHHPETPALIDVK